MSIRVFIFFCLTLLLVTVSQASLGVLQTPVSIEIAPAQPLIQLDRGNQFLNFDFRLKNILDESLTLSEVEVSAYDRDGELLSIRRVDVNGTSPSISTTTVSSLLPQKVSTLYNPFYGFPAVLKIHKLSYQFSFASQAGQIYSQTFAVFPKLFNSNLVLQLPLRGRFIVDDGNDFYSHHRRLDFEFPILKEMGVTGNFSRYGYDLIVVNKAGKSYTGDKSKKENWFGYGASIYAPEAGKVVALENGLQENSDRYSGCQNAFEKKESALLAGNYVVIDHGNGAFSMLGHLKTGSIKVAVGEFVKKSQAIGELGLSGCSGHVHLHYELRNGPDFKVAEGLPSYFSQFRQITGSKIQLIRAGTFNTGDIIESE